MCIKNRIGCKYRVPLYCNLIHLFYLAFVLNLVCEFHRRLIEGTDDSEKCHKDQRLARMLNNQPQEFQWHNAHCHNGQHVEDYDEERIPENHGLHDLDV